MSVTDREERIWAAAWIGLGIPTMIAGCIQGYRHDDGGTMTGTVIVTVLILVFNLPTLRGNR